MTIMLSKMASVNRWTWIGGTRRNEQKESFSVLLYLDMDMTEERGARTNGRGRERI